MRSSLVDVLAVALMLLLLLAAIAWGQPDSLSLSCTVSAAQHEIDDGFVSCLGKTERLTLLVEPGTELARYLAGHNGQRVVVSVREWRGVK